MDATPSSPGDTEHELLQEYANQDGPEINSESNPFPMTSLHVAPSQPLWHLDPDDENLPLQNPWQYMGTVSSPLYT